MAYRVAMASLALLLAPSVAVHARERVRWQSPPPLAAADAARLQAELARAVAELAPRVPIVAAKPLVVAVEPDFVAVAQRTNEVAEAVQGDGATADLHLVYHPEDGAAYRFGIARALLRESGVARGERPWLELGAALWLSGEWYGRPYADWAADLAVVDALPTAEELLAREPQADGSRVLWLPVVAAVLDGLPGTTAQAKLAAATPENLRRGLSALAGTKHALSAPAARRGPPPRFLGASLAMMNGPTSGYQAPSVIRAVDGLAKIGFDAVSIMPFAGQRAPDEPTLRYLNRHPSSETDAACVFAARQARAAGLKVLWKPHIWVHGSSWPGEIAMRDEEGWRLWWRAYQRFVLHQAVLARWSGAEAFSLGVELDRTLERRQEWSRLISAVRRIYPGHLTYASNWYEGYERVWFWGELDFVGVDAYFPLAESEQADPASLARGARRIAERLEALSRRTGKPVVLTEVGFAARRAAWKDPHHEGGEYSEADQATAYRALLEALAGQPWLGGLFVWKAFSVEIPGNDGRPDFRFLGRAAEKEIRAFLARERGRR